MTKPAAVLLGMGLGALVLPGLLAPLVIWLFERGMRSKS